MMKMEFTAIGSSLILSLAITFMCAVAEIAPGLNCRSSDKILNRKVGKRSHSVSFPLIHIYSECSPFRPPNRTWESLMSEKIRGDANRLRFLKRTSRSSKEDANANVPVRSGSGEYIIQVDFGTPKQSMYTLIDTGSDVAWIPCKQCQGCHSTAPIFDPAKSSSYKPFACDSQPCQEISGNCGGNSKCQFEVLYGDGTQVDGTLASDAITLGSQYLPNFSFGCAESLSGRYIFVTGTDGIRGRIAFFVESAPPPNYLAERFLTVFPARLHLRDPLCLGRKLPFPVPV
jgi:hypothetical protein